MLPNYGRFQEQLMDCYIVYEPVSRFRISQYSQISEYRKFDSMEGINLFF